MARTASHAVRDVLEAIQRVEALTRGKSFQDFDTSWQMQWLVQRAIEIISEASRAIPDDIASLHPDIPWRKVRGIGNVLRHDYAGLSNRILWNVVLDELPRLKSAMHVIAAQLEK